jgi:hypothetical protein
MLIKRTSLISGITREMEMDITKEEFTRYINGVLLQDAFPHLTDSQREFFKTGITDEEWQTLKEVE